MPLLQGFKAHWYNSNRVLQVYDGSKPADRRLLLKHVPQQPGLHMWLIKPPCNRCAHSKRTPSRCAHSKDSCKARCNDLLGTHFMKVCRGWCSADDSVVPRRVCADLCCVVRMPCCAALAGSGCQCGWMQPTTCSRRCQRSCMQTAAVGPQGQSRGCCWICSAGAL
jgi:hypothetical protein